MERVPHVPTANSALLRHALAVLALVDLVAWLFGALATDQRIASHEGRWIYDRVAAYRSEIAAGQFPPQVFPETVDGGGSAFPFFYPPAAYLIACLTSAATGSVERGVHLAFALSALLSGVFFYAVATRLRRSSGIALLGAALYLVAPYRFVDILVRGALAECWTFVWYPPIALGVVRILQGRGMRWYLPVCLGMLLLTHTVMSLYAVALAAPFVLARPRRAIVPGAAALILAAGLAAWHLVPMGSSLPDVRAAIEGVLSGPGRVPAHAPAFAQLFQDSSARWFEYSLPGPGDGMCFALGPADFMLLPLCLVATILLLAGRRATNAAPTAPLIATAAWALTVLFVLFPETFLAVAPKEFRLIQFPWRLLGIATFLSALAVVFWLAWFEDRLRRTGTARLVGVLAVAAALVATMTVPAHHRIARSGAVGQRAGRIVAKTGFTVLGEYLPREFAPEQAAREVRRAREEIASLAPAIAFEREGSTSRVQVRSAAATEVTLPLLYYGFYAARSSDGRSVPIIRAGGLLRLGLHAGDFTVEIAPRATWARRIGTALSAAAALAILVGQVLLWRGSSAADMTSRRRASLGRPDPLGPAIS